MAVLEQPLIKSDSRVFPNESVPERLLRHPRHARLYKGPRSGNIFHSPVIERTVSPIGNDGTLLINRWMRAGRLSIMHYYGTETLRD